MRVQKIILTEEQLHKKVLCSAVSISKRILYSFFWRIIPLFGEHFSAQTKPMHNQPFQNIRSRKSIFKLYPFLTLNLCVEGDATYS